MSTSVNPTSNNVKTVEIAVSDFKAFAVAVNAAFPAWKANRQVQLVANFKAGTMVLRALNGYAMTAAEVATSSAIAAEIDAEAEEAVEVLPEITWHRDTQRLQTKRDRSRRGGRKVATGLGRGDAWAMGGRR